MALPFFRISDDNLKHLILTDSEDKQKCEIRTEGEIFLEKSGSWSDGEGRGIFPIRHASETADLLRVRPSARCAL